MMLHLLFSTASKWKRPLDKLTSLVDPTHIHTRRSTSSSSTRQELSHILQLSSLKTHTNTITTNGGRASIVNCSAHGYTPSSWLSRVRTWSAIHRIRVLQIYTLSQSALDRRCKSMSTTYTGFTMPKMLQSSRLQTTESDVLALI